MGKEANKKNNQKSEEKPQKKKPSSAKKKVLIILPVIVILIVIGVVWFILSPNGNVAKAQLLIESGTVQVKHGGGAWTSADDGMFLYQSDSVKTGENTSATIVLFESSIIRLDNNTEVMLREIIQQVEESSVKIQQDAGRTWNTVLKISGIDNYEVQTPTTVASVRGTAFVVMVSSNGETYYGMGHGTLNVSSLKNGRIIHTITINKDEAVTIHPDLIDQPPEIKPFEKDNWILKNQQKDDENTEKVKEELYSRIEPYIPELKERYGVTDEELDTLIDGYLQGYYDLPPETPDWIRDIIELS